VESSPDGKLAERALPHKFAVILYADVEDYSCFIGADEAGTLLGLLPVGILYSFFVEHYVSSMTGAVKE
jgi:ABC-type maltose transport system permease subunit